MYFLGGKVLGPTLYGFRRVPIRSGLRLHRQFVLSAPALSAAFVPMLLVSSCDCTGALARARGPQVLPSADQPWFSVVCCPAHSRLKCQVPWQARRWGERACAICSAPLKGHAATPMARQMVLKASWFGRGQDGPALA